MGRRREREPHRHRRGPGLRVSGGPDGGMGSVVEIMAGMAVPETEGQALENRAVADAENALEQGATRGGINWNPLRAPSLEKYMLAKGDVAANASGRQELFENVVNRYVF